MMYYLKVTYIFAKIGLFSFGGGMAMLPLIFQEVQRAAMMTAEEFSNLVALSQVTPGPVAVNAATYVGYQYGGIPGSTFATIGVALPSFVIVLIVSSLLKKAEGSSLVDSIFTGIRPVTVGLIASAAIVIGRTSIIVGGSVNLLCCAIFAVSFVLIYKFKLSPIKIMLIMGAAGALLC